jgi:hypothetical protein
LLVLKMGDSRPVEPSYGSVQWSYRIRNPMKALCTYFQNVSQHRRTLTGFRIHPTELSSNLCLQCQTTQFSVQTVTLLGREFRSLSKNQCS